MTYSDIEKGLEGLTLEECKDLVRAARARIGRLLQPTAAFRERCRVGTTATAVLSGVPVTGEVLEIVGGCALLRFASGEVAITTADKLLEDGYGRPATALPPRVVYDGLPEDHAPAQAGILPVLYMGAVYIPAEESASLCMAYRAMRSVLPEYLPRSMVQKLAVKREGMGLCV